MPFPWLLAAAAAPVIIKGIRKDKKVGVNDWTSLFGAVVPHVVNKSKAATADALEKGAEVTETPKASEVPEVPEETTGGTDKTPDTVAKENGFLNQEFIPGTTNAKFLEMAVKGVANKYTLQSTQNACQANIDDHTERHRSKASGNVTRSYDTVMNSGACRGLAATQAQAQNQTSRDMAEIMKRYDAATELGNQVDVPGNDGDQVSSA